MAKSKPLGSWLKVYPGKWVEGRKKAEERANKTGKPVSLLHQVEVQRGPSRRLVKVWTTYDTVYPSKSNPHKLIPAKVIIGSNGRMRVFVEKKQLAKLKRNPNKKRVLDVFARHQLRIARDTLKMSDVGARIMGGMTKEEARRIVRLYGGGEKEIKKLEE